MGLVYWYIYKLKLGPRIFFFVVAFLFQPYLTNNNTTFWFEFFQLQAIADNNIFNGEKYMLYEGCPLRNVW